MAVKIPFKTMTKARDEEVEKSLRWVEMKMGEKLTPPLREAYKTGLEQGWGQAEGFYKMQGIIETDY